MRTIPTATRQGYNDARYYRKSLVYNKVQVDALLGTAGDLPVPGILHVSAGTGTDTRTGLSDFSVLSPWATVEAASQVISDGDVIWTHAGSYAGEVLATPDSINYTVYCDAGVVFDKTGAAGRMIENVNPTFNGRLDLLGLAEFIGGGTEDWLQSFSNYEINIECKSINFTNGGGVRATGGGSITIRSKQDSKIGGSGGNKWFPSSTGTLNIIVNAGHTFTFDVGKRLGDNTSQGTVNCFGDFIQLDTGGGFVSTNALLNIEGSFISQGEFEAANGGEVRLRGKSFQFGGTNGLYVNGGTIDVDARILTGTTRAAISHRFDTTGPAIIKVKNTKLVSGLTTEGAIHLRDNFLAAGGGSITLEDCELVPGATASACITNGAGVPTPLAVTVNGCRSSRDTADVVDNVNFTNILTNPINWPDFGFAIANKANLTTIVVDNTDPNATDVRAGLSAFDAANPFDTINAAQTAAAAEPTSQLVKVLDGSYSENVSLRQNTELVDGVVVTSNWNTTFGDFFILGLGEFRCTGVMWNPGTATVKTRVSGKKIVISGGQTMMVLDTDNDITWTMDETSTFTSVSVDIFKASNPSVNVVFTGDVTFSGISSTNFFSTLTGVSLGSTLTLRGDVSHTHTSDGEPFWWIWPGMRFVYQGTFTTDKLSGFAIAALGGIDRIATIEEGSIVHYIGASSSGRPMDFSGFTVIANKTEFIADMGNALLVDTAGSVGQGPELIMRECTFESKESGKNAIFFDRINDPSNTPGTPDQLFDLCTFISGDTSTFAILGNAFDDPVVICNLCVSRTQDNTSVPIYGDPNITQPAGDALNSPDTITAQDIKNLTLFATQDVQRFDLAANFVIGAAFTFPMLKSSKFIQAATFTVAGGGHALPDISATPTGDQVPLGWATEVINYAGNTFSKDLFDFGSATLLATLLPGDRILAIAQTVAGQVWELVISRGGGAIGTSPLFYQTVDVSTSALVATSVIGAGQGSVTIPAAKLSGQSTIKVMLLGILTDANPTDDITVDVLLNGTNVGTVLINLGSAITDEGIRLEFQLTVRTGGVVAGVVSSGGTVFVQGGVVGEIFPIDIAGTTVVDLSVDSIFDIQVAHTTAGNNWTTQQLTIEQTI